MHPIYSDFKEIRKRPDFVDRTESLKYLQSHYNGRILQGPQGCGKSTYLSMVAYWLDNKEDASEVFAGTAFEATECYREEKNRYPVIAMTFRDFHAHCFSDAVSYLGQKMREVYYKFMPELLKKDWKNAGKSAEILLGSKDESVIQDSLRHLIRNLKDPVVLLDDMHRLCTVANRFGYGKQMQKYIQKWCVDAYTMENHVALFLGMQEPDKGWFGSDLIDWDSVSEERMAFRGRNIDLDDSKGAFFRPLTHMKENTTQTFAPLMSSFVLDETAIRMLVDCRKEYLMKTLEEEKEKCFQELKDYKKRQSEHMEPIEIKFPTICNMPELPKNKNYRIRNNYLQILYQVYLKQEGESGAVYHAMMHIQDQKEMKEQQEMEAISMLEESFSKKYRRLYDFFGDIENKKGENWLTKRLKGRMADWDSNYSADYTGYGMQLKIWPVTERKEEIYFSDADYVKVYLSTRNEDRYQIFFEALDSMLEKASHKFAAKVAECQRDDAICIWVHQEDLHVMDAFAETHKEKLSRSCLFLAYRGKLGMSREPGSGFSHMKAQEELFVSYFEFAEIAERPVELYDAYQFLIDRWNGLYDKSDDIDYNKPTMQMVLVLLETLESIILDREVRG
ncbi:MAG: AAA family ATPase, partial [Lachnospiraceae bacterium]